jgi:hypothetical protein
MTLEELNQSKQDLALRKRELTKNMNNILEANIISSKGKNRVLNSIAGFPDNIKRLTDGHEAALVTILFEIKNTQIAMFTIQSAIDQQGDTNGI